MFKSKLEVNVKAFRLWNCGNDYLKIQGYCVRDYQQTYKFEEKVANSEKPSMQTHQNIRIIIQKYKLKGNNVVAKLI